MVVVKPETLLEYIIVEYRWLLVIPLLPISLLWKIWATLRNYVVFKLNSAPQAHEKKVKDVQSQIKTWLAGGCKTKLCTARPTWQTMSFRHAIYKKTFTNINVNLIDILDVDAENRTVRCEPLVTMGQLSRTLELLGLALAVVPELDQLTVGGLVMGTGIETSSHVYGLFQHICVQYELVLADGSVEVCSKDKNPDLFYAVPWSYGTLGFLTAVIIKVVPAKKYVRLEYYPYKSLSGLSKKFQEESTKDDPHQFVEALLYNKHNGVVMIGDMVDQVGSDGRLNPIGEWQAEWFFKQVEKHLYKSTECVVEYIPLRDYYHRHTRSYFWELQDIIPFGNNVIFRHLFGWLMPPEVSLMKLTQPEAVAKLYNKAHVIQDMLVPMETLEDAVDKFHQEFQVYPIWLCPFKLFDNPGQLRIRSDKNKMYVDIGVYGVPQANGYEAIEIINHPPYSPDPMLCHFHLFPVIKDTLRGNRFKSPEDKESSTRNIEKFVEDKQGFQMLYADTYTTREEFRRMFDHTLYDKLRDTLPYCKEAFPEIYDKVNRNVRK